MHRPRKAPLPRTPHRRGQIFSTDAIISAVVFIIVLAFILSLWNIYAIRLSERVNTDELERNTLAISRTLIDTTGTPSDWDETGNATVYGLQSSDGSISANKLDALFNQDIDTIKESFNIERFNLRVQRVNENNTIMNDIGDPQANETTRISMTRIYTLNDEVQQLRVTLWD